MDIATTAGIDDLILRAAISIILGYLLGSIPFGLLLTRAAGLGDIRNIGSGNIGATNVLRTGNKGLAAATLLLDAAKGAVAVLVARYFILPSPGLESSLDGALIVHGAGVAAFLGHVFPVWLRFKGGKGVATYIGVMLVLNWAVGLIFCAVWLLIAVARRYSSLAALTAAATAPIFAYVVESLTLAFTAGLLSVILILRHWSNLRRLWAGTEPQIGNRGNKAG